MNIRYIKIVGVILALVFLSGCAVFVRGDDWHHHHRGYWHHSSLQQSNPSVSQLTAHGVYRT